MGLELFIASIVEVMLSGAGPAEGDLEAAHVGAKVGIIPLVWPFTC